MGKESGIEWTDSTWNPWLGCTKVSPGCRKCYAERITEKLMGRPFNEVRRSKTTFDSPLRWKEPRMVFTCSMSDFFHEDADAWRDEAWEVIRQTPQHTYQILTKRPERIQSCLPGTCFTCGNDAREGDCDCSDWAYWNTKSAWPAPGFWPNVWLGTSVEMPGYIDRIETAGKIPAVVHFLSAEPLLGPVSIYEHFDTSATEEDRKNPLLWQLVDWVIVGGESGPVGKIRPMKKEWAEELRDECLYYKIPFFFKQWGGSKKCKCHGAWGCRLLDGRVWDEIPEAS